MSSTTSPELAADVPAEGPARRAYFDALFARSEDPWDLRGRWYEGRKRALVLACLPRQRYQRGYEPGCANGELSALLAPRCGHLLISDGSDAALGLARTRTQGFPQVTARRAWLPDEWPHERFDLIVLSEFAYYLGAAEIDRLVDAARGSLRKGGAIVACHYRPRIGGCTSDGDDVHRRLAARLDLPLMTELVERDFRIGVWCAEPPEVS